MTKQLIKICDTYIYVHITLSYILFTYIIWALRFSFSFLKTVNLYLAAKLNS
jgi:hypothetical protein